MIRRLLFALAPTIAFASLTVAANADPPTPLRHLVFAFQVGINTSVEEHNSGFNASYGDGVSRDSSMGTGGNGVSTYAGRASDEGTIAIDVVRVQPDQGLVVSVAEHARGTREAKAATCVVYGAGTVICDPNAKVNVEEIAAIRLLGRNFVDPALIDAHQHWRVQSSVAGATETADYTIQKNDAGVLTIEATRTVSAGPASAVTTATIRYDMNSTVPTLVSELTTERRPQGTDYSTMRTQIDLHLQNDSIAQVH